MFINLLICINLITSSSNNPGDTTVWLSSDCEKKYRIVIIKQKVNTCGYFYGSTKNENNKEVYFRGEISDFAATDTSISFSISRYVFSYKKIVSSKKISNRKPLIMHDFTLPMRLTGIVVGNNSIRAHITPKIAFSNFEVCFFSCLNCP